MPEVHDGEPDIEDQGFDRSRFASMTLRLSVSVAHPTRTHPAVVDALATVNVTVVCLAGHSVGLHTPEIDEKKRRSCSSMSEGVEAFKIVGEMGHATQS